MRYIVHAKTYMEELLWPMRAASLKGINNLQVVYMRNGQVHNDTFT